MSQVAVETDDLGGGDGGGVGDSAGGGGDDGASGAQALVPGVAESWERTLTPRAGQFQVPFCLGWCCRSCSAFEAFGPWIYDVRWDCERCDANWPSTSKVEVPEYA